MGKKFELFEHFKTLEQEILILKETVMYLILSYFSRSRIANKLNRSFTRP